MQKIFYFFVVSIFLFTSFALQVAAQNASRSKTFDVQHYVIRTSFNRPAKTVTGDTTVILKPLDNNFTAFNLDAANLQFTSVTVEPANKQLSYQISGDQLTVKLDKPYSSKDVLSVRFKYTARPKKGLYFIEPRREGKNTIERSAQIWTQGEPEESRHWFPSYDFPDDKATSEQFITVNSDETAIANGELIKVETNGNNTKTFHFKMNLPHSTYLTSLIVGKYAKVSDKYNDIPLGFYVYPGSERIVEPAYGKTKKMFRLFENLLDYKYPFNKYDQAIVAAFTFGGMENITATTMADSEIFAALTESRRVETENLVSHELAHSWFGNLVTTKDWSNLWLNEGFATFMESIFLENEYGRTAYNLEMRRNAETYFTEEAVGIRHPLLNQRARPDIFLFDATTYKKGGFVVHMLRETVGDELFWKSINNYLNAHKFGNVETADLQKAFEQTSGRDLNWFFDQWIRKAGFPRLRLEPRYDAANKQLKLTVRQTQKVDSQTPETFRLFAELEIVTATGSQFEKIEMNQREQTFTFQVSELPAVINFDKRGQILKKVETAPIANE